jgi:Ca2+-binding EF-hand superfamily protein
LFRRIDQNDNGVISWDEFRAYFRDGVATSDELKEIFDDIDTVSE